MRTDALDAAVATRPDTDAEVERLRAELARERAAGARVRAAAEHRRSIIESTSDFVFVKDGEGRYVDANAAYLSALGRRPTEVFGRRDRDLFPADVAEQIAGQDCIAQIAGQVLEAELSVPMAGRRRHLLVRRTPWHDESGATLGVVTVATDITERKETELQREKTLADLRGLNERVRVLLDEQLRLSQRASGLLEMSRRLVSEQETAAIYSLGVEAAERQLSGAAVFVASCAAGPNHFTLEATGERSDHLKAFLKGVSSAASFGAELHARCAASALLDPRYPFDAALLEAGMRAVTAMPIALDADPIPVIVAAWRVPRECACEDLWFLENLVAQLALALQNAALRVQLCRFRSSSERA